MYLTIQALVLRVTEYNERDALLTLLTKENGKLTVKARGLRRKNSPLAAPCQLLAYSEFTIFEYRDMYTINEAHSLELFQPLRSDLTKLALGSYFIQVADVLALEDYPNPQLLTLVLNCLYALAKLPIPIKQIKAAFELRCACIAGYSPDLFSCHICGIPQPVMFDLSGGILLCNGCLSFAGGIRMPVNRGVLDAMRYIVSCEPQKLLSFTIGDENLEQLSSITEAYLTTQLERGFSTLDFYKSLLVLGENHV